MFGSCECPPEGEADLIIVGDSSFALVAKHDDPAKFSRLSFGELLRSKDYAVDQIRSVYTGLKGGKGLSAIIHKVWELIAKVERENRLKGRETLPILVVVGWAVNDVHGDFGFQGFTWIHQKNMNRTEADRRSRPSMLKNRTKRSSDPPMDLWRFPVIREFSQCNIGNGDHTYYSFVAAFLQS